MRGRWVQAMVVSAAVLLTGGGSVALAVGGGADVPAVEMPGPEAEVVPGSVPVVYIATGENFPDALAGAPVAGMHDGPVLLVRKDLIPIEVGLELIRLDPDRIVILGGTGVVSTTVETTLATFFPSAAMERWAGDDRYETAVAVSEANYPAPRITVAADRYAVTESIEDTCTSLPETAVTIDTPVAGTIVVHANVTVRMYHVTGTGSLVNVLIGASPTDCSSDKGFDTEIIKDQDAPTEHLQVTVPLSQVVDVGPGVHTFYINAIENYGSGASFRYAAIDAVFYPDP